MNEDGSVGMLRLHCLIIILLSFTVAAHSDLLPDEYPLLENVVSLIDANSIKCASAKLYCVDPAFIVNSNQDDLLFCSTATIEGAVVLSVSKEKPRDSFFNFATYYGTVNNLQKVMDDKIENNAIFWYAGAQGLYGVAQKKSVGNPKDMYRTVRLSKNGSLLWDNPAAFPRPTISMFDPNIEVLDQGIVIGKFKQTNTNIIGVSRWQGNITHGGFCYAVGTEYLNKQYSNKEANDFDITVFVVKKDNTTWSENEGRRVRRSDLDRIIGGGIGIEPGRIRLMSSPTVVIDNNVVYMGVRYDYASAAEEVTITGVVRLAPDKEIEFVDYEIEYRNDQNPVLNADCCRDETGMFKWQPAKRFRHPMISIDVAEKDLFCTINGGRIWLLDLR